MKRRVVSFCTLLAAFTVGAGSHTAHAADPTTADCLGASEAALKLGNDHKVRAERAQLLVCAASSCPADIRKECGHRIDELNAQIPTIIFQAKDGAGKDISAVKVTMDGEMLAERLEGTAVSIDPGKHTFVFETAGQAPVSEPLIIQEGEKDRRERVVFGAVSAPAAAPAGATSVPASPPSTPDGPSSSGSGLGTQKILAIVAGGVGVVGLGVGSAFGLMAMSKKSDAQSACPNVCADQKGVTLWSDAKSAGNISTVAFIVGGVAVAGGAALWLTAKPELNSNPSAQIGIGPGSVQLRGAW